MATNTSTVGATGRDYATITLWEAATDNDLVVAGNIEVGECYSDATFAEHVTFAGAVTDASNYRVLRAASGHRHNGTYAGSGAGGTTAVLVYPNTAGHIFTVQEDFLELGLGMTLDLGTSHGSSDEGVRVGDASSNCKGTKVNAAIIHCSDTSTQQDGIYSGNYKVGTTAHPIAVENCVIKGFQRCGVHAQQYNTASKQHDWLIVCCTIADCGTVTTLAGAIGWQNRFNGGSQVNIKVIDCIAGDNSSADLAFTDTKSGGSAGSVTTTGSANNYSVHATEGLPSQTLLSSFVDTDPGSAGTHCWVNSLASNYDDLVLVDSANNDVLAGGVGPSLNALVPTVGALGNTRSGTTCDPGAFEVTAAAGGAVSNDHLAAHIARRGTTGRILRM